MREPESPLPRERAVALRACLPAASLVKTDIFWHKRFMSHWQKVATFSVFAFLSSSMPRQVYADTFQVTKTLDSRDGRCDGDCSLREAVIAANQHPGPDLIVVPAGIYVLRLVGDEDGALAGDLDILDDVTITGAGQESTQIAGDDMFNDNAIIQIHDGTAAGLQGLAIQNAVEGISNNGGTLILEDSVLSNLGVGISNTGSTATATLTRCALSGSRGGVFNHDGVLTLTHCSVNDMRGTGIHNDGGMLTLDDSTLSRNTSGGICNRGTATLTNCTLSDNSTTTSDAACGSGSIVDDSYGGGAINNRGDLTLSRCTLIGNSVIGGGRRAAGGAIYNNGRLTVQDSQFIDNSATGPSDRSGFARGGAIYNSFATATATLTNCTLSGNSTDGGGSAIENRDGTLTLENCNLSGNVTGGNPAAEPGRSSVVDNWDGRATATLTNCTLSGNSGTNIFNRGTLMLVGSSVHGPTGLGIENDAGTLTLERSTLSGLNQRGIFNAGGTATLTNCTLSGNSGARGAALLNANRGTATLTNCTLSGNSVFGSGGTIYDDDSGGTVTLGNTIVANTLQGRSCVPAVRSNGHNLDDDGGCGLFGAGDLSIVSANLAPLGDYGGPTSTHALCTGPGVPHPDCTAASPAIDAGDDAQCPATDQRGAPRPHGPTCDIGAFESGAPGPPPHTATPTASPKPTPTPGPCYGNCNNDSRVTVDELVRGVTIALGTADLDVCPEFDCNGNERVTVDCLVKAVNAALNGCAS